MDDRVREIFDDASSLYEDAVEELQRGKLRNAAEKAWGAVLRATNALILARTGEEIEGSLGTSKEFDEIGKKDGEIRKVLEGRYYSRESSLHGRCFYMGVCEPIEVIERRIRETNQYIEDAKKLAGRLAEEH